MKDDSSADDKARAIAPLEIQGAPEPTRPLFELTTSPHFAAWLAAQRASLVFTTCQTRRIQT